NEIGTYFRILAAQRFWMAVPLDENPCRFPRFVEKLQRYQLVVLDIRFAAVVEQLRRPRTSQADADRLDTAVRVANRFDNLLLDEAHIGGIDAGFERTRPPKTNRVRSLMVMGTRD